VVHTVTIHGTYSHNTQYIQSQYTVHTVTVHGTYSHSTQYIQSQYTVHTVTVHGTYSHSTRYLQSQYTVHTVTVHGTYSHQPRGVESFKCRWLKVIQCVLDIAKKEMTPYHLQTIFPRIPHEDAVTLGCPPYASNRLKT